MATEAEYQARIETYSWNELDELWSAIQYHRTTDWESGKALEYLILRALCLHDKISKMY